MTPRSVLQEGQARRARRQAELRRQARRRRRLGRVAVAILAGLAALLVFMASSSSGPGRVTTNPAVRTAGVAHHAAPDPASRYGRTAAAVMLHPRLKLPLRSGILFDVHTGNVLWARDPGARLPIASLTKMMTALVVVAHEPPQSQVLITREALDFSGSGVGELPLHKRVPVETLLYGLMLPSGNDAAIALSLKVAGSQGRFVSLMNARAASMGLSCTHFSSVSGIVDQDNYSCTSDLAQMAHAVLEQPRLARIVASSSAILPMPIKGGKVYLYNNNPLLRMGYAGTDGVKTGYTLAAGPCLVATARRGRRWLGVVLLHSADTPDQAEQLLNLGFRTPGA